MLSLQSHICQVSSAYAGFSMPDDINFGVLDKMLVTTVNRYARSNVCLLGNLAHYWNFKCTYYWHHNDIYDLGLGKAGGEGIDREIW